MSEHKLPQAVREARGLVGLKTPKTRIPATFRISRLGPNSNKARRMRKRLLTSVERQIFDIVHLRRVNGKSLDEIIAQP